MMGHHYQVPPSHPEDGEMALPQVTEPSLDLNLTPYESDPDTDPDTDSFEYVRDESDYVPDVQPYSEPTSFASDYVQERVPPEDENILSSELPTIAFTHTFHLFPDLPGDSAGHTVSAVLPTVTLVEDEVISGPAFIQKYDDNEEYALQNPVNHPAIGEDDDKHLGNTDLSSSSIGQLKLAEAVASELPNVRTISNADSEHTVDSGRSGDQEVDAGDACELPNIDAEIEFSAGVKTPESEQHFWKISADGVANVQDDDPATTGKQPERHDVPDATQPESSPSEVESQTAKWKEYRSSSVRRNEAPLQALSLTVAIVGDSGIGKTTLARTLVSAPEVLRCGLAPAKEGDPTVDMKLYRASTLLKEDVRDGEGQWNLHILDTPGFGMHPNAQLTITKVLSHQRAHFTRLDADFTRGLRAGTLASYVCNPTAPKNYLRPTDTFIYTLLHRIKPVDVAYIRALTDVGTVVLVLVKCDGLGPQRVREMKREVLEVVKKEKLRVELFGLDVDGALAILQGDGGGGDARVVVSPFAVTFKGDAGWGGAAKESVKVEGENKGEVDETRELTTALFVHAGEMRQGTAMKFAEWREHISKEERDGESRRRDGAPSDSSQVIQPDDTAEIPPSTSHNAAPRDDALTATEVLWLVAAFSLLAASFVFVSAGAFCAKGSRVAAAASHCGDRAAARAATRAATEGASAAGMLWAQWRGF